MTLPFLSVSIAVLYFGWLWHDRKATDRTETHSTNRASKPLTRPKRYILRRLKVARRTSLTMKTVAAPIAPGVTQ